MQTLREYQKSIIEILPPSLKSESDSPCRRIHIDEDKLDIFWHSDIKPVEWQPYKIAKSYAECTSLSLDIETTGLGNIRQRGYINADFDPLDCVIKMIGLKSESGGIKMLYGHDEESILREFVKILCLKKPELLFVFNGVDFDIPFLVSRLEHYEIMHPFKLAKNPSKMASAMFFGKPKIFHQWHLNWGNGQITCIIDLFFQALAWDNVQKKLTEFSLKRIPEQMGLRDERDRVELSNDQIQQGYKDEDWELLCDYLEDDLEDTKMLADAIFPSVYYQQLIIPYFNLQQLHIYGIGAKINKFMTTYYQGIKPLPESSEKMSFVGGMTRANCGLYLDTVKADVESLYPTIMGLFGICSEKDDLYVLLAALAFMKAERIVHKARKNDKSLSKVERNLSRDLDAAFKVIINSFYGALGAMGIEYNDYFAAAMVTAYGRAILKHMLKYCQDAGTTIVNIDTDAVAFSVSKDRGMDIFKGLQASLPPQIKIEYEWCADVYIPAKVCIDEFNKNYKLDTSLGRKRLQKLFPGIEDIDIALCMTHFGQQKVTLDMTFAIAKMLDREFLSGDGLRKNYIVYQEGKSPKAIGKFKKRNFSVLQKTYAMEYIGRYRESKELADHYYQEQLQLLQSGDYQISDLAVTRKISISEVTLVSEGLGQPGDIITFYTGIVEGVSKTVLMGSGYPYSIDHYSDLLTNDLHAEIMDTLFIQKVLMENRYASK